MIGGQWSQGCVRSHANRRFSSTERDEFLQTSVDEAAVSRDEPNQSRIGRNFLMRVAIVCAAPEFGCVSVAPSTRLDAPAGGDVVSVSPASDLKKLGELHQRKVAECK